MSNHRTTVVRRRIERSVDWLGLIERYFVGLLMIAMTGLYAFNVFVRMFFPTYASAVAWIDEAARYMMVWVVFLAAGITLEVGRHVTVNIAHQKIPSRFLPILLKFIDGTGLIFSIGASLFSLNLAIFVAGTGQVSPTLGVPTFILYVAPFIGFLLLAFRFLLRIGGLRDARQDPAQPAWLGGERI